MCECRFRVSNHNSNSNPHLCIILVFYCLNVGGTTTVKIDALCSEIHSSVSTDEPTTCITEAFFTLHACIKYCLCGTTEYTVVLYGRSRSFIYACSVRVSDYGLGPGRRSIFALGPLLFFLLKEPAQNHIQINANTFVTLS